METIEKKKRGRPKGSVKITGVTKENTKVSSEDLRNDIQKWLNGSQKYDEGLKLFHKVTKKTRIYARLIGHKSETNRLKLEYELNAYLKRTEPIKDSDNLQITGIPVIEIVEDINTMENLSIKEKIQKWLDGPKDYQAGRKLLRIVPGQHLHYLELCHTETYECKVRLGFWLKGALKDLKEEDKSV